MKKSIISQRRRNGFTLAEVLIVVAIIGILLAVALPNVISYRKELKLAELDDDARTIFVAAQNELTALKNAGVNLKDLVGIAEAGKVGETPEIAGVGKFTFISSKSDNFHKLVPAGSFETKLQSENYVVEFDAKSGAVYAVWYWEDSDFDYEASAYVSGKIEKPEERSNRRDAMVGYYGGTTVDRISVGQMPIPEVNIINAEELRLDIKVPEEVKDKLKLGVDQIVVDVYVNGEQLFLDGATGTRPVKIAAGMTGTIVLDTLKSYDLTSVNYLDNWTYGMRFKMWGLDADVNAPGKDLSIKVVLSHTGKASGDRVMLPQSVTLPAVNSLFESVSENTGAGAGTYTAKIAYGRHLQNLHKGDSTSVDGSNVMASVTEAVQTRDINFALKGNASTDDDVYFWADIYDFGTGGVSDIRAFHPISNTDFEKYDGKFDGVRHEIRNLNAERDDYVGLFSFVVDGSFNNITLVNPSAHIIPKDGKTEVEAGSAGALIGSATSAVVDSCWVYNSYDPNKDPYSVYEILDPSTKLDTLVITGDSGARHTNLLTKQPFIGSLENNSQCGGLIGVAYDHGSIKISDTFVSVVCIGTQEVGGFIGNCGAAVQINRSYASCFLYGNRKVGGLIGFAGSTGEFTDCYAAGEIKCGDKNLFSAAGLARLQTAGNVTATNSYAAVRFIGADGVVFTNTENGEEAGMIYGTFRNDNSGSNYFIKQSGVNYQSGAGVSIDSEGLKSKVGSFGTGTNWSAVPGDADNTNAYRLLDATKDLEVYPYPMLLGTDGDVVPQYGDWLESSGYVAAFYWENEQEGTTDHYHFYFVMPDGSTKYVASDLCTDHHLTANMGRDIDAWGYGLIGFDKDAVDVQALPEDTAAEAKKADIVKALRNQLDSSGGTASNLKWESSEPDDDVLKEITDLLDDDVFDDNVILLKGAEKDDFHAIETDEGWLEVNLGFAAAIDVSMGTGTGAPSEATHMGKDSTTAPENFAYQIRTAQQLDNMGGDSDSTTNYFKQTHDVIGTGYGTYKGIGTFSGNYNGGFYRILDLKIGNGGLFRSLKNATVEDVILYSPTNTATLENYSGSSVGGIAWQTASSNGNSTITNCIVAGYTINGNGSHVGGLVGHHLSGELVIKNCAAVNTLSGNRVGGLVGLSDTLGLTTTASELKIIDSYAGGSITSATGSAGGLVGSSVAGNNQYQDGNVTYEGSVYSYVNMKDVTDSITFRGIGPGTVKSGGTAKYWNGGIPSGVTVSDTGNTGVSLSDLNNTPPTTQHTYIPDVIGSDFDTGLLDQNGSSFNNPYPFTPVVKVPAEAYDSTVTTGDEVPVHYGVWAVDEDGPMVAYIEMYGTNDYGMYVASSDGTSASVVKNSLRAGTGVVVKDDYYRILSKDGLDSATTSVTLDGNTASLKDEGKVKIGTEEYFAYTIDAAGWDEATNYYHTVKLTPAGGTEQTYLYNPSFACEAFDVTEWAAAGGAAVDTENILSKNDAGGSGTTITSYTDTGVVIRSARQLANVQEYTNSTVSATSTAAQGWTYEQLMDVDFVAYEGTLTAGKTDTDRLAPAELGTGSSYNGHGKTISNLYIGSAATGAGTGSTFAGLFGYVNGGTISEVRLVDVDVNGDDGDIAASTGGLVGKIESGSVTNCGIYVSGQDKYASFTVSGSGENGVGGLIGQMTGGSVTGSFAAVKVEGTGTTDNPAGGLFGQIIAGEVSNCYAGGFVDGTSQTYKEDSVNVTGNNNVGGFVGSVSGSATFAGVNYSTASVGGGTSMGLFCGSGTISKPTGADEKLYAVAKAFDKATGGDVTAARDESDYLVSVPEGAGTTAHPYNQTGDYPYATNLDEHYGDWIGLTKGVYFDTVGGKTGYYANGNNIDGFTELVARGADVAYATDDGYMFLSEEDLGDVAIGINGEGFVLEKDATFTTPIGVYKYAYKVPGAALNTMPAEGYYFTVNVNGQFYTANFAFAGEIFDYGKVTDTSKPAEKSGLTAGTVSLGNYDGVAIRSARQVADLGILTNADSTAGSKAKTLAYEQLLDINFSEYKGDNLPSIGANGKYNHEPITLEGSGSEKASYNGNGYSIIGLEPGFAILKDENIAASGLFSRAKYADLKGIRIVNSKFAADTGVTGGTGGGAGGAGGGGGTGGTVTTYPEKIITTDGNGSGKVYFNAKALNVSSMPSGTYPDNVYLFKNSDSPENNDFFAVLWTSNSDIETTRSAEWKESDFGSAGKWSGNTDLKFGSYASTTANAVRFTTSGPAKVQVWWVKNNNKYREMAILDESGNAVAKTSTVETVGKGKPCFSEFNLSKGGTYYIGGLKFDDVKEGDDTWRAGGNYLYRFIVEVTSNDPGYGGTTGGTTGGNTSVSGDKIRVGALAGILDNATVKNCGVYVEPENGGVTYEAYDAAYNKFEVKNTVAGSDTDLVGGLAGNVTGSTVEDSFAAVKVTGVRVVGGFAGRLTNSTIDSCYVGGHTYQGTFFGKPESAGKEGKGIVNVQATAKPGSGVSVAVGGFAGDISKGDTTTPVTVTFKGVNYSTASFGIADATPYMGTTSENDTSKDSHLNADLTFTDDTTEMGQFIGKVREGAKVQLEGDANIYAMGEAFVKGEYVGITATAEGNGYEKHENDDGYDFKTSGDKDVPYINHKSGDYLNPTAMVADVTKTPAKNYDTDLGENYPYAQAQYIHHGDWTSRYNLIYYEVYDEDDPDIVDKSNLKVISGVGDGNLIGFYAVLRNEDNSEGATINTLSLTGHVIDSGYMVLSDAKVDTMKFSINSTYGGKLATENSVLLKVAGDDPVEFKGTKKDGAGGTVPVNEDYYIYPVPFATINIAPSDTYYQHVTINGQPYMLNQHFACEAINVGLVGADGKMDYDTVRAKPGVQYYEYVRNNQNEITGTKLTTLTETQQVILIRSPWNLAGMARYTRDGNESTHRADARKWTYLQTMDIDYTQYKEGQIYDGNTNNRSEPVRTKWFAGTNYPYGQAPAQLIDGGRYNGNGHIIANLYISSDSTKKAYVGLFGLISGKDTVVENIYMEQLYVNAWGGPDDGIYVGGVAGEVANGATLRNVSVHNLEMDFHKVPTWDKDNSTYKEGGTTKFKAVGGVVGHLTGGSVSNVYVNGLSIDFDSTKYSYSWTHETATDKNGAAKEDYFINRQYANSSSGTKYGSSVHKDQGSMSVGGAIGEISGSASGAKVSVTDVYVVDPAIEANKGKSNYVGGVVGKADGKSDGATFSESVRDVIVISDCGVYLSKPVGSSTGDDKYYTTGINSTADKFAGGFVGRSDEYVRIENSFAAIRVWGQKEVGGFAGHIEGSWIENCFAGGHTEGGEYEDVAEKANVKAAGPEVKGTTYKDGEARTDDPKSGSFAGGFAGVIERSGDALRMVGTVYSTASVYSPEIKHEIKDNGKSSSEREYYPTTTGGETGVFVGDPTRGSSMKSMLKDVEDDGETVTLYATGIAVGGGTEAWDEATEYGLLTGLNVPTGNADATNHYDVTLNDKTYPFKNETKVNIDGDPDTDPVAAHFGDWAETKMVSAFYYEVEGGVYNYYSLRGETTAGKFGDKALDSLCKERDGKEITAWGYGYIAPAGVTVTVGGTEIGKAPTDSALKTALESEFGVGVKVVKGAATAKAEPDVWKFDDGSGNTTSFYVNTAYGAAIEAAEKDSGGLVATTLGSEKNAYQIRAVGQLDNIVEDSDKYFKQSHDIVDKDGSHKSIPSFKGSYDGGEYRIIDITEPVFNGLADGAKVHNVIVYAPEDSKTITGNGAIANTSSGNVNIENTVVAGYTIDSGSDNVGGLVGEVTGGELTIKNSEATNRLSGGNVGGLVGTVTAGTLNVEKSYAGGSITKASSAGGLVGNAGTSATVTYENVYSYVDMTSVDKTKQLYGIGPQVDVNAKDTIGFWGGGVSNVNTDDHKLRKALLSLVDWSEDPAHIAGAEHTYIPIAPTGGVDGFTDRQELDTSNAYYKQFPFKAYATNESGSNVHYGDWPLASKYAGLFYWEKEIVFDKDHPEPTGQIEYHFYAYGSEFIDGKAVESELIDTLCYDHHENERASIIDSGYGYFYDNDGIMSFSAGSNASDFVFKDVTDSTVQEEKEIRDALSAAFDLDESNYKNGKVTVYLLTNGDELTDYTTYRQTVWTLKVDSTTSIGMKVFPMFGAAIYGDDYKVDQGSDKNIESATPFAARTVRQFANMANNEHGDLDYYALSHDIDFKYAGEDAGVVKSNDELHLYTPSSTNEFRAQVFDGFGYRIVDFNFEPNTGDAALILDDDHVTTIKNLIMYSPDGTGKITAKSGSAGGFIASSSKVKFENCVVSGYTITGTNYVGGLIGEIGGNLSVKNCQTYVNLVGSGSSVNGIGGIAGHGRGTITDCYSGGTITGASSSTKVGGIYGAINNSVTVKNCYTYMDLKDTSLGSAKVYPIGETSTGIEKSTCSYYKDNFPDGNTNAGQATAVEISGLAVKEGENKAEYSWWPEDSTTAGAGYYGWVSNQKGGFPFRPVASYTEDGAQHYVHYGQWPNDAQVMGIAYWELYTDGSVGLQIAGVDKDGKQLKTTDDKIFDTLRKPGSTGAIATSNDIEATGYAAFSTIYNMSVSMSGDAGTKANDDTAMKVAQALDEKLLGVCTHMSVVITPEGTAKGTVESANVTVGGTSTTLYYSSGYAGVSYDATFGQKTAPFEIRTVAQLDNIPDSSAACFLQTHDLYGETYTSSGSAAGDPKYTGAADFAGTYDGQGYKILDLSMKGTDTDVGLFASIDALNCKLQNIIMYAPNGATISGTGTKGKDATDDHYGVGGLVGSIGSSTSGAATIENCVVAGYTITGNQYVGGLIGWGYFGADIKNCAAVNDIECKTIATAKTTDSDTNGADHCGAGGILGGYGSNSAGQTNITNCYSGGTIKVSGDNKTSAVVGGIAGVDGGTGNGHAIVKNCYTYVDLSKCASAKVSVISSTEYSSSKNNYYLNDSARVPIWVHKQGEGKTYSELNGVFSGDGFGTATESYVTTGKRAGEVEKSADGYTPMEKQTTTASFQFPEVVREITGYDSDGNAIYGDFVHYGDWPAVNTTPTPSSYPWTNGEIGVILGYSDGSEFNKDSYVVAQMFKDGTESNVIGSTTKTSINKYIGLVIGSFDTDRNDEMKNSLKVIYVDDNSHYIINGTGVKITETPTSFYQFTETASTVDFANKADFGSYKLYGDVTDAKIGNDVGLLVIVYDSAVAADTKAITFSKENIVGYVEVRNFYGNRNNPTTSGSPGAPEGPSFEAAVMPAEALPVERKVEE